MCHASLMLGPTKQRSRHRNQLGMLIVGLAVREAAEERRWHKSQGAVERARLGGLTEGKARAANPSLQRRADRRAVQARPGKSA